MQSLSYVTVADAIARAESDNERLRAARLLDAYYSTLPSSESVRERVRLLKAALERHLPASE